jgi:hypothetical protein
MFEETALLLDSSMMMMMMILSHLYAGVVPFVESTNQGWQYWIGM